MGKIELLAPAGSAAALTAAVQSGADAVYLGADMFSARQGADNFTLDEVKRWTDYCHFYNVKVHAAVNTLVKENELPKLIEYAYALNESGVDAVIVQDMGAVEIFKRTVPMLPLHASTQMTVTSLDGVRFLEDMGFERVVLARELSAEEISYICERAKAEIEVFAHGALCMSYSGQCLMSSVIGGRSGNRGRCAQPCRLPCTLNTPNAQKSGFMLSPKDLALINDLPDLKKIGVASLKIEGRLKRPEYVSAVVGIYRKYLDSPGMVTDADMTELKNAFNRGGFTRAYFGGCTGKTMMCHDNSSNAAQNIFTDEAKKRAVENADVRKIPISAEVSVRIGEPIILTMTDSDYNTVTACSDTITEEAHSRPTDSERIKKQISKLGGTGFSLSSVSADIDKNAAVSISVVNAVRREAVRQLTEMRIYREPRTSMEYKLEKGTSDSVESVLTAEVRTAEQLKAVLDCGIKIIYAPKRIADAACDIPNDVILVERLPDIYFDKSKKSDSSAVMISSPAQLRVYEDRRIYGNFRLNIYNSVSADFYSQLESVTLSPELNIHEVRDITSVTKAKSEVIVYGRLPLMIMRNCPLKAAGMCQKHKSGGYLTDRFKEKFPILCSDNCTAELINSKPVFMADKISDIHGAAFMRMIFTTEDYGECINITGLYQEALNGKAVVNPFDTNDFTRGHWYRGVL